MTEMISQHINDSPWRTIWILTQHIHEWSKAPSANRLYIHFVDLLHSDFEVLSRLEYLESSLFRSVYLWLYSQLKKCWIMKNGAIIKLTLKSFNSIFVKFFSFRLIKVSFNLHLKPTVLSKIFCKLDTVLQCDTFKCISPRKTIPFCFFHQW